jgi:hypothetical protein
VTLAYTDPPALTAAARVLVNDLDLVVIDPTGRRFLGNVGLDSANESAPGGAPDRANNVGSVFVARPAPKGVAGDRRRPPGRLRPAPSNPPAGPDVRSGRVWGAALISGPQRRDSPPHVGSPGFLILGARPGRSRSRQEPVARAAGQALGGAARV